MVQVLIDGFDHWPYHLGISNFAQLLLDLIEQLVFLNNAHGGSRQLVAFAFVFFFQLLVFQLHDLFFALQPGQFQLLLISFDQFTLLGFVVRSIHGVHKNGERNNGCKVERNHQIRSVPGFRNFECVRCNIPGKLVPYLRSNVELI